MIKNFYFRLIKIILIDFVNWSNIFFKLRVHVRELFFNSSSIIRFKILYKIIIWLNKDIL